MFGKYRLGYAVLFAVVAAVGVTAVLTTDAQASAALDIRKLRGGWHLWALPLLVWLGIISVRMAIRRTERPTLTLLRMIRRHRHWVLRGGLLLLVVPPLSVAFSALKGTIPSTVPFYLDPVLADLDHAIFGMDAWRVTHAYLGPIPTVVIDRFYILWILPMIGTEAWLNFTRDMAFQLRGLLTFLLTWILLGIVGAMALSSVGPVFYEQFFGSDRFVPLTDTLHAYNDQFGIKAVSAMNFLLKEQGQGTFGAGISAMPSLHVSMAFLLWLLIRDRFRHGWPVWLASAWLAMIWLGSVHLGWHYFTDGLFGILGTCAIWIAAGRFVDWLGREPRPELLQDVVVPAAGFEPAAP